MQPITAREALKCLMGPFIASVALTLIAYVHLSLALLVIAIIIDVGYVAAFVLTIVVFKRRTRERHG